MLRFPHDKANLGLLHTGGHFLTRCRKVKKAQAGQAKSIYELAFVGKAA